MHPEETQILQELEVKSRRRVGQFARQLITAMPEDKEEILAGIEVERTLAAICRLCLDP